MVTQKIDMTVRRKWGFSNILSSALGIAVVFAGVVGGAYFLLMKLASFTWPTLKWGIPLGVYLAITVWFLYRSMLISDEVARTHRRYQATILIVRNLIVLAILFAQMRTVGP